MVGREVYTLAVSSIAISSSLILGLWDYRALENMAPYIWLAAPVSVMATSIVIVSISRKIPLRYTIPGIIMLSVVAYNFSVYLGLQSPQLITLAVFFVSSLAAINEKKLAIAILIVFIAVAASNIVISKSTCYDNVLLQLDMNGSTSTTTTKGSKFTVWTRTIKISSSHITIPVHLNIKACNKDFSFNKNLILNPLSYSKSQLHFRLIIVLDIVEVNVKPTESLWSTIISSVMLNKTQLLNNNSNGLYISVLFYKNIFIELILIPASILIASIAYKLMSTTKADNWVGLMKKFSRREKVKSYIIVMLLLAMCLHGVFNVASAQQNLSYRVMPVKGGIDVYITRENKDLAILGFRQLFFYNDPYDCLLYT
ncbi:MAG: hypothetical protein F7C81_01265, partial [Desulfurococcales archaeon]|nr:hypothetical protein [Desulfurococcales archaeon]